MNISSKSDCEYLREIAKQRFDRIRQDWIEYGSWLVPHRITWLQSRNEYDRARRNRHIVDQTHILAHRSYVAGFMEGNTSSTRPWYRCGSKDPDINLEPEVHSWLDKFTRRTLQHLMSGNFYNAAPVFYSDYGVFNTGAQYIEEKEDGSLFFHDLVPGSYFVLNDGYGQPVTMVREFSLTVKALIETYAEPGMTNISSSVRYMYDNGNYSEMVDIVQIISKNTDFEPDLAQGGLNKKWISKTYESHMQIEGAAGKINENFKPHPGDKDKWLEIKATRRKPFIVGKSHSDMNFEYGLVGPTSLSLGSIRSLNKKAISKDQAIEQILRPAMQGPSTLRKSYVSTNANTYVPIDAMTYGKAKMERIFEISQTLVPLVEDVQDLRQMVDKLYFSDFLLYLTKNPKTRTATETEAIVQEQQLVIGPQLQSLNWSYNVPVVDYVMDYTLYEDRAFLNANPIPDKLQGESLRPEFISVFAQAQRAADLPVLERYLGYVNGVAQIDPKAVDKFNVDKYLDIIEDRLYLPAGVNRDQGVVDAMRESAQREAQQMRELEKLNQATSAAKNVGVKVNQGEGETQ